ncbi:replication initiator protein [Salmonella enterica subsp. enterica serovar Heidelberg str. SL476]|uniref:Replication initiator protein n=1 Tax=Salmonella heidelberg (strain SL476) TaxID=454169 RepID=A0A6C6ZQ93_SALHS|nr:replication initiator protein [Salmonella enterica subsp. enterica serovar Heidelberg str. SL476]
MGSCAAPSAKGDDKFITTDYLQQCPKCYKLSDIVKLLH